MSSSLETSCYCFHWKITYGETWWLMIIRSERIIKAIKVAVIKSIWIELPREFISLIFHCNSELYSSMSHKISSSERKRFIEKLVLYTLIRIAKKLKYERTSRYVLTFNSNTRTLILFFFLFLQNNRKQKSRYKPRKSIKLHQLRYLR